jgi:drug/metabolite transporter (DMT)-like permease
MIGAAPVLAWVMITGFVALTPVALVSGVPTASSGTWAWLWAAGIANVVGLLMVYAGLRVGKVGIVAAIASTEGAITAIIAAIAGEPLTAITMAVLVFIAAGIFLAALAPDVGPVNEHAGRAALFASGAALLFGFGLYAAGRVSADVPAVWVVFPARVVGVTAVALPLVVRRRLTITRSAAPLVVAAGMLEVIGFVSFTFGARHSIAIAAVLASQFAAISAIAAYLLFHEKLARFQIAGVVAIVAGVTVLTLLRA